MLKGVRDVSLIPCGYLGSALIEEAMNTGMNKLQRYSEKFVLHSAVQSRGSIVIGRTHISSYNTRKIDSCC